MRDNVPIPAADAIDAVLPQTQCRRCGYDACRPYAEAIAQGEAINRCPPGGDAGIMALASVTGRAVVPLAPEVGRSDVLMRAEIDEAACIGCTLCIEACPVDAIVGGPKRMHTVIAALCSGCELCVAPCPVDCITLMPAARRWSIADAQEARGRYKARQHKSPGKSTPASDRNVLGATRVLSPQERSEAVSKALARARARRGVIA